MLVRVLQRTRRGEGSRGTSRFRGRLYDPGIATPDVASELEVEIVSVHPCRQDLVDRLITRKRAGARGCEAGRARGPWSRPPSQARAHGRPHPYPPRLDLHNQLVCSDKCCPRATNEPGVDAEEVCGDILCETRRDDCRGGGERPLSRHTGRQAAKRTPVGSWTMRARGRRTDQVPRVSKAHSRSNAPARAHAVQSEDRNSSVTHPRSQRQFRAIGRPRSSTAKKTMGPDISSVEVLTGWSLSRDPPTTTRCHR